MVCPGSIVGYLIGGIIPAILLGVYNALQKVSSQHKISPGMYLIVVGSCVVTVGLLYCFIFQEVSLSPTSSLFRLIKRNRLGSRHVLGGHSLFPV